jgi:hypothetical protein
MDESQKMVGTLVQDFFGAASRRGATPAQAAAALMAAASAILVADFGEVRAVELMHSVLDEASAAARAARSGQCAGSC